MQAAGMHKIKWPVFIKFGKSIFMSTILKKELIDKISATEDENLLQLMKEDYDYFTGIGKPDIADELSPDDLDELKNLLKESFGHETESYEDFKKALSRWRTK